MAERKISKLPVSKGRPNKKEPILEDMPEPLRGKGVQLTFEGLKIDTTRLAIPGKSDLPCGKLRIGQVVRVVHEATVRDIRFFRNKDGVMIRHHVAEIDVTKPVEVL